MRDGTRYQCLVCANSARDMYNSREHMYTHLDSTLLGQGRKSIELLKIILIFYRVGQTGFSIILLKSHCKISKGFQKYNQ